MANEFGEHSSHSAEYFGDTRDYWWNADFIELMAKRWRLHRVREALDVGCGVGHWGRLLSGVLPEQARVTGVDRDPFWIEKAKERAQARGQEGRFHYLVGVAEQLPFADDSFDLVTCQTVLIHARDPRATIAEMIRVTRPGGLIAVAEPNNAVGALLLDASTLDAPIDEILALARFQLTCERGKEALGEGNNSAGDRIPALFHALGLEGVRVYLSDKASLLLPPYDSPEQRALVEEMRDLSQREFWIWNRADTLRYFTAGGGTAEAFEACWAVGREQRRRAVDGLAAGTFTTAGGGCAYLVSGTKPERAATPAQAE
jgi:SAM-dependent methyltransferase